MSFDDVKMAELEVEYTRHQVAGSNQLYSIVMLHAAKLSNTTINQNLISLALD